jgi:hypothetical protein
MTARSTVTVDMDLFALSVKSEHAPEMPWALEGLVEAAGGRTRLALERMMSSARAGEQLERYRSWRRECEAVFNLGGLGAVEQFCRLGVSLVSQVSDGEIDALMHIRSGARFVGEEVSRLATQVVAAGEEISDIATSGWALMDDRGQLVRRDLSLSGRRVLVETEDRAILVEPTLGYLLTEADREESVMAVSAAAGTLLCSDSTSVVDPLLSVDLVRRTTGVYRAIEISAHEVFAPVLDALTRASAHARSQQNPVLVFYGASSLEPTYD